MTTSRERLGASPFLLAGSCAGFLLAVVEVLAIALWHPGRQPLELEALDWIGSGSLVGWCYAAAGMFHGSWLALFFRRSLERRGREGALDAARLTAGSFLWITGTALGLWSLRQGWPGGFEALGVSRLLALLLVGASAFVCAVLLTGILGSLGRRFPWFAFTCLCAGTIVFAWRSSRMEEGLPASRDDAPRTSVVLVIADALRADRIGAYARNPTRGQPRTNWDGREHASTPSLDRLAREGTTFDRFFVQAPFTWGSFASFFTGLHASEHGLLAMDPGTRLSHRLPTVGEAFRARGYETAAFLAGTLTNGSGLARGFDVLFEKTAGRGPFRPEEPTSALFAELFPMRWLVRRAARGDREIVVSEAIRHLRHVEDEPFFLVVHLFGTHTPYDPPERFRIAGTEDSRAFDAERARSIEEGRWHPDEAERAEVRALYDGCVQWVDHQIGRLLSALEDAGRLDDTEVWVTADHGEELFDHRVGERYAVEHDWMWNTNLRVPLIVRGPGWEAGARVSSVRSSVEWSRELAQRHALEGFEGPTLSRAADGSAVAVAENHLYRAAQDERYKLLVERTGERRAFLYDLWVDPDEEVPLGGEASPHARAARDRLADAIAALRERERAAALSPGDAEGRRAFEAYGYLGGARPRRQVEPGR